MPVGYSHPFKLNSDIIQAPPKSLGHTHLLGFVLECIQVFVSLWDERTKLSEQSTTVTEKYNGQKGETGGLFIRKKTQKESERRVKKLGRKEK